MINESQPAKTFFLGISLLLVYGIASPVIAAPPKVDGLFPAGGARGTKVTVQVIGSVAPWPPQVWVSRAGVQVSPATTAGTLEIVLPADTVPGVIWLRCATAEGVSAARPFIVGVLPEIQETKDEGKSAQPQVLETSQTVINGKLDPAGDVDDYSVPLLAGQTVVADLIARRTLGSPMDAVLQILTPDKSVLDQNDDTADLDPRIVFTAPIAGRYVYRVFTFPAEGTSAIALSGGSTDVYRLTVTTGPFADHAWPSAVPAANSPAVRLIGWNIPEPATSPILIDATRPEWLNLGGRHFLFGSTGSPAPYSLPVKLVPHAVAVEAEPTTAEAPQTFTAPFALTGRIDEPGDIDVFRFSAKKGTVWQARVDSQELDYELDAVLSVTDAQGKVVAQGDDVGARHDIELLFTTAADGEYLAKVKDLHGRGGLRFVYQLTIAPAAPDYAVSVAAESFVIAAGKPLEIPVTIERRHGFAETIEIVAQGLPATVMATVAKSEAKGDSAKTTKLVLTSNAAISIPFQLIAKSETQTRPVLANAIVPKATLPELWLTVTAP